MDYQHLWVSSRGIDDFGERMSRAWVTEYLASTGASRSDLVDVDPGNGFVYVFDLAGSLGNEPCDRAPRVIGVWGRSAPLRRERDPSRRRGHPRPRRGQDDRGHLVSCAAGGGYDINLVPMDAALNRGRSEEGARFRAMERRSAAVPGRLFFVRPVYDDETERPARFEVGVQVGDDLHADSFSNAGSGIPVAHLRTGALRAAAPFRVDADLVNGCLDATVPRDRLFCRAWHAGPAQLTRAERASVAGVTGHVAESLVAAILDALEWRILWHLTGPGVHGVDLVVLAPDEKVVAIEVKGSLVAGRIPPLSRRELHQMSAAWIDNRDNPGMTELGLGSTDIYGGVVVVNFADLTWRAGLTSDFARLQPVTELGQLSQLTWLDVDSRAEADPPDRAFERPRVGRGSTTLVWCGGPSKVRGCS